MRQIALSGKKRISRVGATALAGCCSLFLGVAAALTASPAAAQILASNDAFDLSAVARTSTRAGEIAPFRGLDVIRPADIVANGGRLHPEARPTATLSEVAASRMERGTETIIGYDSRMRLHTSHYPNRAIVYIERNGQHHCTGFLISPDTVVTSAHCVHQGRFGDFYPEAGFELFPGNDGTNARHGSCGAQTLFTVPEWANSSAAEYDFAAIKLDCTIGNTTGWFGLYSLPGQQAFRNQSVIVPGYSGDKPQQQWGSAGRVLQSLEKFFCYRADTIGGNSGGPLLHDRDDGLAAEGQWAFGVHGYGVGGFGAPCGPAFRQQNGGVRTTQDRIDNFFDVIRVADAPASD